jgi:hypothetical protein
MIYKNLILNMQNKNLIGATIAHSFINNRYRIKLFLINIYPAPAIKMARKIKNNPYQN